MMLALASADIEGLKNLLSTEGKSLSRELAAKSCAEAELRQHAQELERQVEARTQSLRETMAQMEEFSYTVSHDLRSPLRTIRSSAAMLEEENASQLDQAGKDYLSRVTLTAVRMHQLTTDVLSYSKIERAEVVLAPTDVGKLFTATVELYPELQPPAQVIALEPIHRVMAHEPSLRQCLTNPWSMPPNSSGPAKPPAARSHRGESHFWIELPAVESDSSA